MATGLTPKQEKFVQELIKGKSQREAYKSAYDVKKMSDGAVDREACLLLKSPKVTQRFEELRGKAVKRTESKAIITREEIIKGIASIANDDISNYLDFRTEKTLVGYDKDTKMAIVDYAPVVELKDSTTIDTKNIKEISVGRNGVKVKRYDRDTALYKLADLMGLDEQAQKRQKLAEDKFAEEKKHNEFVDF